jgi:indole-3-glycerol phosphate synthase
VTTSAPFDVLATIVSATRKRVESCRERRSMTVMTSLASKAVPDAAGFVARLCDPRVPYRVIAECKRRSPSRGVLRRDYDPVAIAAAYERAGAAAISVLTEPSFFDGSLEHLEAVKAVVGLPVLRKDFTVDEYQVVEARAAGADAVLLIVAALTDPELARLLRTARDAKLAALVEVHDASELERAIGAGSEIIGVNNRSLKTLDVSVATSNALIDSIPDGCVAVAESGLRSGSDLRDLRAQGYDAFLVGERLVTADEPGPALEALLKSAADPREAGA